MMKFRQIIAVGLILLSMRCFSQVNKENDEENNAPDMDKPARQNFFTGLYLGSYFANKYTANFYDGYGYDVDGNKNDFLHSFMYRRIIMDYGGINGQPDQIAQALNVNPGEWTFDQSDMPVKMKYNPAFIIGLQMYYLITDKDMLLLNLNTSKLSASGVFTIVKNTSQIGPQQPNYDNIQAFSITGTEQRFFLQFGYRRMLGQDDLFNFFIEGGASMNTAKYLKNQATINQLLIDLSSYYMDPYYPTYRTPYLRGTGLGIFGGFGLNLDASNKWNMQLTYSPSYERIHIGKDPEFTFHHTVGIKAFYKFF